MPNIRRRRIRLVLFLAFLVAATILGALMLQQYHGRKKLPPTPSQQREEGNVAVSLFFASPDGDGLVREGSEIDPCGNDLSACIQSTVEKLVGGPLGDLAPTLPPATVIHNVRVQGDTAYLDFGRELVDGLPEGSSAEMIAVYSITDTISFNFPSIKKVKFLLDGHDMESLKGHLDLRKPVQPDFGMEKNVTTNTSPDMGNKEK
jgi:hypothetical protein